ncbi:hypothetical protein [Leptospira alstonii]|uniref:hypothetical protein n=1 Tax=Leptospira alstonii TaxID=28452 RepID=UPI000774362F|nr:hypothetical protein [Leptospira alstonii]
MKSIIKILSILSLAFSMASVNCLDGGLYPPSTPKCQTTLEFLSLEFYLMSTHSSAPEQQVQLTNGLMAYYAAHCDGGVSKKHKRRKENDPIYDLSGKEDSY